MKDILTHIAGKNDWSEDLYVQRVRQGVEEKYPFIDDEVAILRKEVAYLRGVINALSETVLNESLLKTKFVDYNETIESIKTEEKIKVML